MNPCTVVYTVYFDTLTPERQEVFKNHCYVAKGFQPQTVQLADANTDLCEILEYLDVPSHLTLIGYVEYEFLLHSHEG